MAGDSAPRPNILFVFGEDWGRFASAYAHVGDACRYNELLSTPNFDRVAKEGVLFLNARAPAPGCNPCRSSVMSGQFFWQTGLGAIEQGTAWDENIPTWPLELEKSGYFLGYTYEGDFGKTNARIGGKRTAFNSAGHRFGDFSRCVSKATGEVDVKKELLEEVRENFQSFLEAHSKRGEDDQTPFCYCWGPTTTHRGDGWEPGSGKKLWGIDPNSLQGRMPAFMPDVHAIRQDLSDYMGECCALDAGLGVLLEELSRRGALDQTLVVVTGDHGPPGFPRAKATCYDFGAQVPLAVRWPGHVPGQRVVRDFVSTMDLAPTLCEAGRVHASSMTARSLMPILKSTRSGQVEASRSFAITGLERHVAISREGFLPYPQRSLRTADFLYIVNCEPSRWPMGDSHGLDDLSVKVSDRRIEEIQRNTMLVFSDFDASPTKAWLISHRHEPEVTPFFLQAFGKRPKYELYNVRSDPDCMRNLARDALHGATLKELHLCLWTLLTALGDPRVVEEPCRFELAPFASNIEKYCNEKGQAFLAELHEKRSEWQLKKSSL